MMVKLFSTHELKDDCAKGFEIEGKRLFAVRKKGEIHLYWNRCPHLGTPLAAGAGRKWLPRRFVVARRLRWHRARLLLRMNITAAGNNITAAGNPRDGYSGNLLRRVTGSCA